MSNQNQQQREDRPFGLVEMISDAQSKFLFIKNVYQKNDHGCMKKFTLLKKCYCKLRIIFHVNSFF